MYKKAILGFICAGILTINTVIPAFAEQTTQAQESQDYAYSLPEQYVENVINNTVISSVMTDVSVINGRENGYDVNSASTWLEKNLSKINVEGIDTSKYNIVNTDDSLNILNARYASAKKELENNNYYTSFVAKANSTENKSVTAQTIFKDTYKNIYENIGKGESDASIADITIPDSKQEGLKENFNERLNENNETILKKVSGMENRENSSSELYKKKKEENKNTFAKQAESIDTMLGTFKEDLNSNYGNYINSDAYKAIYSAISSTNVTDRIATRQVLPTTISQAELMSNINRLDEQIPISSDTVKQKAEVNKAATQAGYSDNVSSLNAGALQTYNAAVAQAKADSGYLDAYKNYLNATGQAVIEQNTTTTALTFDSQEDFENFASLAGLEEDDVDYYYYSTTDDEISDNRTYIHLDGNSVVLDTQESKMFSDAIKNSGAKVSVVTDTDYLSWNTDNNNGLTLQEQAVVNYVSDGLANCKGYTGDMTAEEKEEFRKNTSNIISEIIKNNN